MKKIFSITLTLCLLFLLQDIYAQDTKISVNDVSVTIEGNIAKGKDVSFSFKEGKSSEVYPLYKSDSLIITAVYRLLANDSRRSETKDSSFRLQILYYCQYKGKTKETKVERMYFLNDKFQFDEKETFNIPESKYVNTQVKISYKGTINQ